MAASPHHYPPALLDINGVAHVISYGRRHTQRLLAEPDAPRAVKVGAGRRWRYDEILKWASGLPRADEGASDASAPK